MDRRVIEAEHLGLSPLIFWSLRRRDPVGPSASQIHRDPGSSACRHCLHPYDFCGICIFRFEPFLGFWFVFILRSLTASIGSLDSISCSMASRNCSNQPLPITQRPVARVPCSCVKICVTSLVPALNASSFLFQFNFAQTGSKCSTSCLAHLRTHPVILSVRLSFCIEMVKAYLSCP